MHHLARGGGKLPRNKILPFTGRKGSRGCSSILICIITSFHIGHGTLLGQQFSFPVCHFPTPLSVKTAYAVTRHHPVTRHRRSKRITSQRLSYSLRTATAYSSGQLPIRDSLAPRNLQHRHVHPALKLRNTVCSAHALPYILLHHQCSNVLTSCVKDSTKVQNF